MNAVVSNASSVTRAVTRVVPRGTGVPAPRRAVRSRTASMEYRALHALVRGLAILGGVAARAMPFGADNASRDPLLVEARHVADSVVPFVFQVA